MAVPLTLSSVPAQTPYIQYVASTLQTLFPYPFEITQDSDLVVLLNGVAQPTDGGYTVSGQGTTVGGNVTFAVGLTLGTIVTFYRNVQIARVTQLSQNGTFFSSNFNNEFNRIYLIMQQLQQSLLPGGNQAYALMIPNSNNPVPTTLLTPAAYANKYLSFDANGNPQPALLTSSGTITQSLLSGLLNPQTTAEAGLTIVNSQYVPGVVDRYGTNTTPGTTDMTVAITAAFNQMKAGGAPMQFLGTSYVHSGAVSPMKITSTFQGAVILGVPHKTILVNMGTANVCPTIQIIGGSYAYIKGFIFTGRTGFSNPGIQLIDDGINRCAYVWIKDVSGFTNNVNNGFIDIVNSNNVWINDFEYWPTSVTGTEETGATIDNNGQFAGIYLHGPATAAGYAGGLSGNTNAIYIKGGNGSGINLTAKFTGNVAGATTGTLTTNWPGGNGVFPFLFENGDVRSVTISTLTTATWAGALSAGTVTQAPNGAVIFADAGTQVSGQTLVGFFEIHVADVVAERAPSRSLWFRQCLSSSVRNCYFENADLVLDSGCRHVILENVDQVTAGALLLDGTQPSTLTQVGGSQAYLSLRSMACGTYTCDSLNQYITETDVVSNSTGTQNALSLVRTNSSYAGGTTPDQIGFGGLSFGQKPTLQSITGNGQTFATNFTGFSACTTLTFISNGAYTGLIMPVGTVDGQILIMKSQTANDQTFAVAATSHVADGVSCVIKGLTARLMVWDVGSSLWYPVGAGVV